MVVFGDQVCGWYVLEGFILEFHIREGAETIDGQAVKNIVISDLGTHLHA